VLGQAQDLEELAKHLNDLGGSETPSAPQPGTRKMVQPLPDSDDEDEGPMRDDGTLPAPDVAPL